MRHLLLRSATLVLLAAVPLIGLGAAELRPLTRRAQ